MESIILNYNSDLYGNTPCDFIANFAENIEITPNQSVALYNVNIERPNIVFTDNQTMSFNYFIPGSTREQTDAGNAFINPGIIFSNEQTETDKPQNIKLTIGKGGYYPIGLFQVIERTFPDKMYTSYYNQAINAGANTSVATEIATINKQNFNYKIISRFENKQTNLVLVPHIPNKNLDFDYSLENNTIVAEIANSNYITPDDISSGISSWDAFTFSESSIYMLNGDTKFNSEDGRRNGSMYFNINHSNVSVSGSYFVGFNNEYQAYNDWLAPNISDTIIADDGNIIPSAYLGAVFDFDGTGDLTISLYENSEINTMDKWTKIGSNTQMICVYKTSFNLTASEYNEFIANNTFSFTFYQKNSRIYSSLSDSRTYYKFHTICKNNKFINTFDNGVIYDSENRSNPISTLLTIESHQYHDPNTGAVEYVRTSTNQSKPAGLTPFFAFNNIGAGVGTKTDYKISNIKGNDIRFNSSVNDSAQSNLLDIVSVVDFNLTCNTKELQKVFGYLVKTFICPNEYSTDKTDEQTVIVDNLYQENEQYNILIKSLPLRVNKSLASGTGISSKSEVIYNLNNIFNEQIDNYSSYFVNKSFYPPQLKFIKLKNKETIKTNSIKVEVRNARTNKLAIELQDCSLELVIK